MKSRILRISAGSSIFLFLIISILASVRPVYERLSLAVSEIEKNVYSTVSDSTGLSLSYKSFSPSILSAINIKGIVLKDTLSGDTVLEVKRAVLSYSFKDFLFSGTDKALKRLSVDGVVFEFDAGDDYQIVQKLKKMAEDSKNSKKDRTFRTVDEISFHLPFDVVLKNISLHYVDSSNDALVFLKSVKMRTQKESEFINADGAGKVSFYSEKIRKNGKKSLSACNIAFTSSISPELDGSSVNIRLSEAGEAEYTVSKLDVLVNYSQDTLSLRTVRSVFPFSLWAETDIDDKTFKLSSEFDGFDPMRLVVIRHKNDTLKKISGSLLYGHAALEWSSEGISYDADTKIAVSKKLIGKPFSLKADIDGNSDIINVTRLGADGDFVNASFTGGFDIKHLQPEGVFTVDRFALDNGSIISTEVYVEPYRQGFMFFAPQLFFNDRSFTALQFSLIPEKKSYDFSFEMDDYSHYEYEKSGHLKIDGSLINEGRLFVQTSVNVSDLFIDSIINTFATFAGNREDVASKAEAFSPFVMSGELYVSTDFKNFSINAPYCVVANTQKERQLVIFSADGSNETIQLSNLELQYGNQTASAQVTFDFSQGIRDFAFTADMALNSVPYSFSGNMSSSWLSVAGDYNFNMSVLMGDEYSGSIQFDSLPVSAGSIIASLSTNTAFTISRDRSFNFNILEFDIADASALYAFNPRFSFEGTLNNYGFFLNTISYSDNSSILEGSGSILWNINEGVFDSVHADVNCSSPLTTERVFVQADVSNPLGLSVNADNILREFYLSCQADINAFNISRFTKSVSPDNTLTAELTATGNIVNPYVSLNVHKLVTGVLGYPLVSKGLFVMDDTSISLTDLEASWSGLNINSGSVSFSPDTFETEAAVNISGGRKNNRFNLPLELSLVSLSPGKKWEVPENFIVNVKSSEISGDFINDSLTLDLTCLYTPGRFDLFSESFTSFAGAVTSQGDILLSIGEDSPVSFNLSGSVRNNVLDLNLSRLACDLGFISSKVDIPFVTFNEGFVSGDVAITGLTTDPEFTGSIDVIKPVFTVSYVSDALFKGDSVHASLTQGLISVGETDFTLGKEPVKARADFIFNRWAIDEIACHFVTPEHSTVPANMIFPYIHYKGRAGIDLSLSYKPVLAKLELKGDITAENSVVEIVTSTLQAQFSSEDLSAAIVDEKKVSPVSLDLDLDFYVGQKVQITVNPFLRGVIVPDTPLNLVINNETGDFLFKGDIQLRGGEIVWLNRNFYMKEGRIVFNEKGITVDPRITIRAETRERDANGSQVTVILSCPGQLLSQFNPVLSSSPARSEAEIMELLGNFITADSDSVASFAMAGGDYFVQTMVMRRIENSLRELCNFDIFSIRANVLQNALRQSLERDNANKQLTVGNFFDNSTVYIGKYFGSALYFDALLNWSYDETKSENQDTPGGLVLQPEFGLEMASPFVNIRLGVAPDLEAIKENMWMPSTSMTLSWKYNF